MIEINVKVKSMSLGNTPTVYHQVITLPKLTNK